jgi:hypothetical protein
MEETVYDVTQQTDVSHSICQYHVPYLLMLYFYCVYNMFWLFFFQQPAAATTSSRDTAEALERHIVYSTCNCNVIVTAFCS